MHNQARQPTQGRRLNTISWTLALALGFGLGLGGCNQSDQGLAMLDWAAYEGHYPLSGPYNRDAPANQSQPLLALVATEQLQSAIKRTIGPTEQAEFTALSVESPIEVPASGYLVSHVCEAHNCPHGVDIIFDAKARKLALIFYRDGADPDAPSEVTCYSADFANLGQLPEAVQAATRAHIISQAIPERKLNDVTCRSTQ